MRLRYTLLLLAFLLSGCAASLPLKKARMDFFSGNLAGADYALGECLEMPERNRLLCYMEKGVILHYMGKYGASRDVLLKASAFVKEQDFISIKDQSTAVMINDLTTTYKGEYSERLWIHTYLMINFLLQEMPDRALVEAKQALEVLEKYPDPLERDLFTRALIALCFENMGQHDSARIEYEKLENASGKKTMRPVPIASGQGELVLFIAQGRIPAKVSTNVILPPSIRISIPRYEDSVSYYPVDIKVNGAVTHPYIAETDMGEVARESLNDRAAQYLTRQAIRAGAKEAVAQEIGNGNEFAEILARVVLFLLEEADTRSWETLPGSFILARIKLDTGPHDIAISSGYSSTVRLEDIYIQAGKRVYRSIRF
ncbi:MAG: hypothetical protein GX846_06930 [Deltaproteobacteria bacterium]|jgi:hypothetical protein|nr:hypothetical protein [Deltaproteobacteria bacterium]